MSRDAVKYMLTATILIIVVPVLTYRIGRYEGAKQCKRLIEGKQSKLLEAPNIIQNQIFPDPDDPRWKIFNDRNSNYTLTGFRFGDIVIRCYAKYPKRGLLIIKDKDGGETGWEDIADNGNIEKYFLAITKAVQGRLIQDNIENAT